MALNANVRIKLTKVSQSKSKGAEFKKELYAALDPAGLASVKGNEKQDLKRNPGK